MEMPRKDFGLELFTSERGFSLKQKGAVLRSKNETGGLEVIVDGESVAAARLMTVQGVTASFFDSRRDAVLCYKRDAKGVTLTVSVIPSATTITRFEHFMGEPIKPDARAIEAAYIFNENGGYYGLSKVIFWASNAMYDVQKKEWRTIDGQGFVSSGRQIYRPGLSGYAVQPWPNRKRVVATAVLPDFYVKVTFLQELTEKRAKAQEAALRNSKHWTEARTFAIAENLEVGYSRRREVAIQKPLF